MKDYTDLNVRNLIPDSTGTTLKVTSTIGNGMVFLLFFDTAANDFIN